jgi:hypothetical protein
MITMNFPSLATSDHSTPSTPCHAKTSLPYDTENKEWNVKQTGTHARPFHHTGSISVYLACMMK